MKGLEDGVIPTIGEMMHDVETTLRPDQQLTIALWAVKTAMVFEHVSRQKALFYTPAERVALREGGEIPYNTGIWLARIEGRLNFYARGNEASSDGPGGRLRAHVTTLAYGRLAVQIVTLRTEDYRGPRIIFTAADNWRYLTAHIWPKVSDSVRWPAAGSILEHGLDYFHERFGSNGRVVPGRSYDIT